MKRVLFTALIFSALWFSAVSSATLVWASGAKFVQSAASGYSVSGQSGKAAPSLAMAARNVAAGDRLYVCVSTLKSSSPPAVSDSSGNIYGMYVRADYSPSSGSRVNAFLYEAAISTALTTASSISVNGGGAEAVVADALDFSGGTAPYGGIVAQLTSSGHGADINLGNLYAAAGDAQVACLGWQGQPSTASMAPSANNAYSIDSAIWGPSTGRQYDSLWRNVMTAPDGGDNVSWYLKNSQNWAALGVTIR